MKGKYLFITLALGLGLTLALLWLLSGSSTSVIAAPVHSPQQATDGVITVCAGGGCDYSTIQAAVDAAIPGDVIKVAAGTYTDVHGRPPPPGYPWSEPSGIITQVVYISKTVTIRGGYTAPGFSEPPDPIANPTTVDAQDQGRVIFIMGNISLTIEGLRITRGGVNGDIWLSYYGGGICIVGASATVRNNVITGNTGEGGGLYLRNSQAVISNNIITDNNALDGGGVGMRFSTATISDNIISSNDATAFGGGLYIQSSGVTLINNIVTGNRACGGGGVYLERHWSGLGSDATLINNVVTDNGSKVFQDCGGEEESGRAILISDSSARLLHTTIARNTGGDGSGVHVKGSSTVAMTNTILVSHTVGISVTGGNTVTVNSILWHDTPITVSKDVTAVVTVNNQFTGNPAFAADGYHLSLNSSAIDKGVNAGVSEDIDGESRPAGTGYDLGADEFWYRIYLPLVLRNQ